MKNLQHILLLVFSALLLSSCVKDEWSKPEPIGIATPDKVVSSLNENFDLVSAVDGQHLIPPKGWCNMGRDGWRRAFQTGVVADTTLPGEPPASKVAKCATASAYLALQDTTDSWLITPPLKIKDGAAFTYTAAFAYNYVSRPNPTPAHATVEVWCYSTSSTSTTAPSLSNLDDWTKIETLSNLPQLDTQDSGDNDDVWFHFYPQSHTLSNYKKGDDDVMYVAFRYHVFTTIKGQSTNSWYFDDVKYN